MKRLDCQLFAVFFFYVGSQEPVWSSEESADSRNCEIAYLFCYVCFCVY